jgi:hypothetical protein
MVEYIPQGLLTSDTAIISTSTCQHAFAACTTCLSQCNCNVCSLAAGALHKVMAQQVLDGEMK